MPPEGWVALALDPAPALNGGKEGHDLALNGKNKPGFLSCLPTWPLLHGGWDLHALGEISGVPGVGG